MKAAVEVYNSTPGVDKPSWVQPFCDAIEAHRATNPEAQREQRVEKTLIKLAHGALKLHAANKAANMLPPDGPSSALVLAETALQTISKRRNGTP
jgi:hypothetical protein